MLNLQNILSTAGIEYEQVKAKKYQTVAPELKSDQLKCLAKVLVEEINKKLQYITNTPNINK